MLKKKGFILLGMMCLLGIFASGTLTAEEEKKEKYPDMVLIPAGEFIGR